MNEFQSSSTTLIQANRLYPEITQQLIVENKENLDQQKKYYGDTALMKAIDDNKTEIAFKWIENGANLHLQNIFGDTALMEGNRFKSPRNY